MEAPQEHGDVLKPDVPPPAKTATLFYAVSLAAIAGALLAEFLIAYQLLVDHPTHAPELIKQTYAAMALGLLVLVAQGMLVYLGLVRPVRENALEINRLRAALDQHCHHDEVTKVLNRMAFDQMIERELDGLKRYGVVLSGIMVDVDGFHAVNEALGYEAGDHVLYELAQLLKQHIRKADCIFRWRSGRFLILAVGIGAEQSAQLAGKLRDLVARHGFSQGVTLSVTLGVAQATAEDSPEAFILRLKTALVMAKDRGHGSVATA